MKFRMLIVLFSGMDIACCLCFFVGTKKSNVLNSVCIEVG